MPRESRGLLRGLASVLLALAACASPMRASTTTPPAASRPAAGNPQLVAIDMFGTQQITQEQLLAKVGPELRRLGDALMKGDHSIDMEAVLDKLYALGDFEDVTPALVGAPNARYYMTIDFVDTADAARRMPFSPRPSGTYPDPDGLIADWYTYERSVMQHPAHRVECPAYHCLGDGTRDPALRRLSSKLASRVPAHLEELATILRDDHDNHHRAAAAYLLAYANDGSWVVKQLVPAFRDSNALVRNNAMRVVADIAFYHPEVEVPVDPVLDAIEYPATLDRNKAAAILDGLLSRPGGEQLRQVIAARAGSTLLAMLRLQQPNNHDYAYRILTKISGKSFGERDYASWDAWLAAQRH